MKNLFEKFVNNSGVKEELSGRDGYTYYRKEDIEDVDGHFEYINDGKFIGYKIFVPYDDEYYQEVHYLDAVDGTHIGHYSDEDSLRQQYAAISGFIESKNEEADYRSDDEIEIEKKLQKLDDLRDAFVNDVKYYGHGLYAVEVLEGNGRSVFLVDTSRPGEIGTANPKFSHGNDLDSYELEDFYGLRYEYID